MTVLNKISHALFKSPLVLLLLFVSFSAANTPNTENSIGRIGQIPPGERPPIDLDKVSQDHIEPGKLYVKFRTTMDKSLDQGMFTSKNNEPVSIGHPSIDNVSRQYSVNLIKPMLYELNQLPEKGNLRTEQHRAHGLHLWYELGLDEQADVVAAANAFSALAEVEFAEPVFRKALVEPVSSQEITEADLSSTKMSPGDQLYGLQWGFSNTGQDIRGTSGLPGADIGAEVAWESVQGNPGIIVAVIDQGFEYGHPDLAANVWAGIGPEGIATVAGNHGTHVAGTIAAVSNNGIGVAGTAGGNGGSESGVKVMSIDIFNGSHGMNKLQVNIYAADHGAVISQNSWGYIAEGVYNQADLDGIDYFNTYAGGGILGGGLTIFAAGNSNSSGMWYPAYYSGAMAIAATTNKDEKAGFSNYGDWIDLAAPGAEIASTAGGSYYWMSGTSMACPHVSGVAALVLSLAPGAMTNQQLWDLLVSTTDNIDARNPEHAGLLGSGRLSARLAIEAAKSFSGNNPTIKHTITSSAGPGGVINPVGKVEVAEGSNQYFSITPQDGYMVTDVLVNGLSIGAVSGHSFTNVLDDQTIHATFTEDNGIKYNINASAGKNGSINPTGDITVREGSSHSFAIKPNNGYYILDVAIDNVSIGAVSSYTFQDVSANHTIRAAFREITGTSYSITASSGANGSISPTGTITVAEGGSQTFSIAPTQGHEIADVTVNNVSVGPVSSYTFSNVSANQAIYATFKEKPVTNYAIIASAGANGSISPTGTITVAEGSSQTFAIAPNQGYEIADVSVNNVSVGPVSSYTFNNVAANQAIHAVFAEVAPETHAITASSGANGSISPTGTITLAEGSSQTFAIAPNQGYEIADVTVNNVSVGPVSSYTFSNVSANQAIHAVFAEVAPETHAITASSGANGSISPTGTSVIEGGSSKTFAIAPNLGHEIADVAVNNVSVGPVSSYTFSNVAADQTIHAVFAEVVPETHAITASAGANGSISPTGTIAVEEGSSQTFSIAPNQGYKIADVAVNNVSVGPINSYTFSDVSADHTIHAVFTETVPEIHVITASAGANGSISPTGNITVEEGSSQTFTITPDNGYYIYDVAIDNVSIGMVSSYTFSNVSADHTIRAAFREAWTDGCLITYLPYLQDFNASSFIPNCWETQVNAGFTDWAVGIASGGLTGTTGYYANFFYQGNRPQNADLISQAFDFTGYTDIALEFKHRYNHNRSSASVWYSLDGGNNWTHIQSFTANTGTPATFRQTISSLAGQPHVKFRWNFDFPGGASPTLSRSWSVDDIRVTGASASGLSDGEAGSAWPGSGQDGNALEMTAFPNPTADRLFVRFSQDVEIGMLTVNDIQGRELQKFDVQNLRSGEEVPLNLGDLPRGIYLVRLITATGTATELVSKQ